ncbi:MAG: hypothetical protein PHX08_16510, partial [Lachnospiraceae bacterium]|nr:hypothetical protein [Lachnospiraceae bacterium]
MGQVFYDIDDTKYDETDYLRDLQIYSIKGKNSIEGIMAHYRARDYEYGINPFDRKYESVQKERNPMAEFLLNAFEIVIGVVASFVAAFIIGMIGMLLSSSELMKTFWGS